MIKKISLENERALLSPLSLDNYQELIPVANEAGLTRYSPYRLDTEDGLREYVKVALEKKKAGSAYPFIVFDKHLKGHAGCTRYMNISREHKVLEIGSTWIGKKYQGTGLNAAMKKLMIDYAFDSWDFEKIEFRIDERNIASRRAVEKLGAVLEGILRENVYLLDGFKRNSCCYGILRKEWTQANT